MDSVQTLEMRLFAFFALLQLLLLHLHLLTELFLIEAHSLSACNNVNLFITAMEQGKHLCFLCYMENVLMH